MSILLSILSILLFVFVPYFVGRFANFLIFKFLKEKDQSLENYIASKGIFNYWTFGIIICILIFIICITFYGINCSWAYFLNSRN